MSISRGWKESEASEKELRKGYRFASMAYEHEKCNNPACQRQRVARRANGKLICEKCSWDQEKKEYDSDALTYG